MATESRAACAASQPPIEATNLASEPLVAATSLTRAAAALRSRSASCRRIAVDAGGLDTGVLAEAAPDGGMLDGAALDGAVLEGAVLEGAVLEGAEGVAPGTRPCRCAAWSARNDASRPASSG